MVSTGIIDNFLDHSNLKIEKTTCVIKTISWLRFVTETKSYPVRSKAVKPCICQLFKREKIKIATKEYAKIHSRKHLSACWWFEERRENEFFSDYWRCLCWEGVFIDSTNKMPFYGYSWIKGTQNGQKYK